MTAIQQRIVYRIHTVVPSVRIHAMDEHFVAEMLSVMHETIMRIVAAKLALLAMRKLAAGKSNVRAIRTVRMINCASRICVKLHVSWDDRAVKMLCVQLKITSKFVIVNRATVAIHVFAAMLSIIAVMHLVALELNVEIARVHSNVLAIAVWSAIRTMKDVARQLNV